MAVKKAIHLKGGGTLLLHYDGKQTYIPSKTYRQLKDSHLKPALRKPCTEENCTKLLAAIFGYSIERGNLTMRYLIDGTSVKLIVDRKIT